MASARGKFNLKWLELWEDWAPEYVQQFDAGRRELGKKNSYAQSFVKERSDNASGTSQVLDFQILHSHMHHQLQTVAN